MVDQPTYYEDYAWTDSWQPRWWEFWLWLGWMWPF